MDALKKLNKLINDILYDDGLHWGGIPMTVQQRLFFVESLELMKKSIYLLNGQDYQVPRHVLNQKDIGYQLRQLIYLLEHSPAGSVRIAGMPIGRIHQQLFTDELRAAYMKAKQLN